MKMTIFEGKYEIICSLMAFEDRTIQRYRLNNNINNNNHLRPVNRSFVHLYTNLYIFKACLTATEVRGILTSIIRLSKYLQSIIIPL